MLLPGTRLLEGRIIRVNADRTINVQIFDGPTLNSVRLLTEATPRQGKDCVILSDGAKFYCFGYLDQREDPDAGTPTEQDVAIPGRNELKDVNLMGLGALIRVSAAEGIELDTGGICATSYCPALGQITHCAERTELVMPGHHHVVTHDGSRAWARSVHTSRPDPDGTVARLDYESPSPSSRQSELHVRIFEPEGTKQPIEVELHDQGEQNIRLKLTPDGATADVELLIGGSDVMLAIDGSQIRLSTLLEAVLSLKDVAVSSDRTELTSRDITLGTTTSARIKIDGQQLGLGNATIEVVEALADAQGAVSSIITALSTFEAGLAAVPAPMTGQAIAALLAPILLTLIPIQAQLTAQEALLRAMATPP
jgi:hypothetical protein